MTTQKYFSPLSTETETEHIEKLCDQFQWSEKDAENTSQKTIETIRRIRDQKLSITEMETFLEHYPLASDEGRALMTLAEALLRIPDTETQDKLIAEKLAVSDWKKVGGSGFFGAMSGAGLGLAKSMLGGFLSGVSKPVIRKATIETVRKLGTQFVVGESISSALNIAQSKENKSFRMSFDMLGEGARTMEDAERYYKAYIEAVHAIGDANDKSLPLEQRHGMSVKLSALHPRYTWTQADVCVPFMVDKLLDIARLAAQKGITLTVDAEESERLEISLDIIAQVVRHPDLKGWGGFGLAVQAYDRRALSVIDYIASIARDTGQKIQIRLVKGAYWDGEIKRAQMAGWQHYPVYTRKVFTDLSYLCCVQKLLSLRPHIYPMFATHNMGTANAILTMLASSGNTKKDGFEFQRLFGMGKQLGDILRHEENCTVTYYAPVGAYEDLLPYLVRRMLENGANTSFVSQIRDVKVSPEKLAEDILAKAKLSLDKPLVLPLPQDIFGTRKNSLGYDLSRQHERKKLFASIIPSPLRGEDKGGCDIKTIYQTAQKSFNEWNGTPATRRANILLKVADLLEQNTGALMYLLQSEGKKTLYDAIAEIREAVDFCRYYAEQGAKDFTAEGLKLNGYKGERNTLHLTGRGVFVAISPWNFPLAIFMGQITAALIAGNTVIAKPAEQTPRIAQYVVDLLHQAGIPKDVLHIIIGDGRVGAELVALPNLAGVVFTGSTEVAQSINKTLAGKDGAIATLIAETGGQNAMIVDTSALPEQVVDDVLLSAFGSAGQRCSALRVLYVQNDIADRVIHLLKGALPLLKVGNPTDVSTDIPPVIDAEALIKLQDHKKYLDGFATFIASAQPPKENNDTYFTPCAYEIKSISQLRGEVFGPVLHIIRFDKIEDALTEVNSTGFGLTFGCHSRLSTHHQLVVERTRAGNIYLNRNMIGAVVGVQPFGGMGLSGTGPKAGGPHYLHRFATEKTVTDNIMATGGNVDLLATLEE